MRVCGKVDAYEQSLIVNPQGGGHYQGVEVCNDCRALAEGKYDSVKSKIDLARAYVNISLKGYRS